MSGREPFGIERSYAKRLASEHGLSPEVENAITRVLGEYADWLKQTWTLFMPAQGELTARRKKR